MRLAVFSMALVAAARAFTLPTVTVPPTHPLIHFNGRWDEDVGTWWGSSGFKLNVLNLESLAINLGPHTTAGEVAIGLSIDFGPVQNLNVTEGLNVLPLPGPNIGTTVVRLSVQGWQNNRINLLGLEMNVGAVLLPFTPQKLRFQFIGDSLTAGQFLDNGIDGSWAFLASETFKAEHNINAQPGACLTDQLCWGNYGGLSGMFFKTEDTGYFYSTDHNFTTPWNFARDLTPTHVVIHIGANDNAYNITSDAFVATYLGFVAHLRTLYPTQPIFVFTAWGWPNADGSVGQYYVGAYAQVVAARQALGDTNIHLIDTTGWVTWADVFPTNQHPTAAGHVKIAGLFGAALETFGVSPTAHWATPVLDLPL